MLRKTRIHHSTPRKRDITCQQVTSVIVDYLTESLARDDSLAFNVHLRECPDCVAFLATYKQTVRITRSLRYQDIPAEMRKRVRQFLKSRVQPLPGKR